MSRRSAALAAFNAMTHDERSWFFTCTRLNRVHQSDFRALIQTGRVATHAVLHNIAVARRLVELEEEQARVVASDLSLQVAPAKTASAGLRVVS